MSLVADVQTFLQEHSPPIVDGSTGWLSTRRRVHDQQHQIVVITEDGGLEPETPAPDGSLGDSALKEPAVQVRVRGEPWDGDGAEEKAQEIFAALHGLLRTDVGETYCLRVKAQTSQPVFIGYDERNRPEFTISFRMLMPV